MFGNGFVSNPSDLNEILPQIAKVVSPEVIKGSRIARRTGDHNSLVGPFCRVPDNDVLPMPSNLPLPRAEQVQDEITDFLIAGYVRH